MSHRRMSSRVELMAIGAFAALLLAFAPSPVSAQIPDEFTNLQVLPKDITKEQLVATMKGFAQALGVRCGHCHVNNGDSFADFDFPADGKDHKKIARTMINMARTINEELLPKETHSEESEEKDAGSRVTCNTCHRGETEPKR